MGRGKSIATVSVAIAALLLSAESVLAGAAMPVTTNIIEISATSGSHSDSYSLAFADVWPAGSFTGTLSWALPAPLNLADGAYSLATVRNLNVTLGADPEVDLGFALTNSSMTDTVSFTITAVTIAFDGIPDAQAAASSSVTVTQGSGSPPGATMSGLFPQTKMYQARYSTHPVINTATVFANLDPTMSFTSGLSRSETETLPAFGWSDLNTTVHMMESQFKFALSPGDQASGTSTFIITPEPASLLLLVFGGSFLRRRPLKG